MGTSSAYDSPKWPGVNTAVGGFVSGNYSDQEKLVSAIGRFAAAYKTYVDPGTAASSSAGVSPGGGNAGKVARSRAAASGARLASFLAEVASGGLSEALNQLDLSDLVGRPLEEVFDTLRDRLCEDGGLLDDVALTEATARTLDELAERAETVEEFDELLNAGVENIEEWLHIYYANILAVNFEQKETGFVRERVSRDECNSFFVQAAELIRAIISEELSQERDLSTIDWNSSEGVEIADSINQQVLDILIAYESD